MFCFNLVCFPFPRGMYLTLGTSHLLVSHKNHRADGILNQHVRAKSWWCSIFLLSTNGTERPKPTQCFVDLWEYYDWRNILSSKVQLTRFFLFWSFQTWLCFLQQTELVSSQLWALNPFVPAEDMNLPEIHFRGTNSNKFQSMYSEPHGVMIFLFS